MAEALIKNYVTTERIACGTGGEPQPGDVVRLFLDQTANSNFPEFVDAVLQFPIDTSEVVREGCIRITYIYNFLYDTADVAGLGVNLRPSDIDRVECVTCCQILHERVDEETERALAAEQFLAEELNAEVLARIAAVNAESAARIAAVNAEAAARSAADINLQGNINTEATARATTDTALQNNINAEATARANADTAINTTLNGKATVVAVPATFGAAGSAGQIASNASFFYWHDGTRWQRVAKDATWV